MFKIKKTVTQAIFCQLNLGFKISGFAGLCLLNAGVSAAGEINPQTLRAASLASTCAACHGTRGNPVSDSSVPGLSQLSRVDIQNKMLAFRKGELPATVMHQLAKGYTDEQIAIIANQLGQQ